MVALGQRLADAVRSMRGEVAVSVVDLQTGEAVAVNGDRQQMAGCSDKIYIMMTLAKAIAAGEMREADVHADVLEMMGPSETPPARRIIARLGNGDVAAGLRRVNAMTRAVGAARSIMTHPPGYYGEEYGYEVETGIIDNLVTTNDYNRALATLWKTDFFTPSEREYILWSMTIASIPLGHHKGIQLPLWGNPDATVYHKPGGMFEPDNTWADTGIIAFTVNGHRYAYAISVLAQHTSVIWESRAYAARLSALAWETMAARYEYR